MRRWVLVFVQGANANRLELLRTMYEVELLIRIYSGPITDGIQAARADGQQLAAVILPESYISGDPLPDIGTVEYLIEDYEMDGTTVRSYSKVSEAAGKTILAQC